jgi:hypothetical protein
MREILEPAIRMAKEGVPHHEVNARSVGLFLLCCLVKVADKKWQKSEELIKRMSDNWRE